MTNPTQGNKLTLLLVDDEHEVREAISTYLAASGYDVLVADGEESALQAIEKTPPDAAIIDVVLDTGGGLALCREIRRSSTMPIILISGKSDETDRIIGLEIGADDFVLKPFNPRELLARVKAVLRRTNHNQPHRQIPDEAFQKVRFGPWILDPAQMALHHDDGRQLPLSSGELRLLQAFTNHPKTVLSRSKLLDLMGATNIDNVFDRSIDNYIARLRKKVEDDPKSPNFLRTYWGGGYALNCDVSSAD